MIRVTQLATFGAGCFWGVELRFRQMDGVIDAAVGYMGGHVEHPSYEQVCSDRSGHAEVCQLEFDPETIRYEELLQTFFRLHDPTQLNRQGADVGSQYRSVIFVHNPVQQETAERVLAEEEASGRLNAPIVTTIEAAARFWPAEDYHQQYLHKRGGGSCVFAG